VVVTLAELCKAVSAGGGELIVFASADAIFVLGRLGELCAAVSTGDELVVLASAVGVSTVATLGELCAAVSIGGGLVVIAPAVTGIGDAATDTLFG